ncbi:MULTISPECIES: hypothetical protein [Streptomyces]|uniref:hypothetical protein n=1 Tax=Streptomyces TaxID=1883 RepID=UPI0036BC1ADB
MLKRTMVTLATAVLGLSALAAVPAQAAPVAQADPPTGCVTWVEWLHEGNALWYGGAHVQCDTGTYQAKAVCHYRSSGQSYVAYGNPVEAPDVAVVACAPGGIAQIVQAVPA